jgi:hypothetical protein
MGNSKLYNDFMEWIGKIGTREGDYFMPYLFLDELRDEERNEIEKIMYDKFKEGKNYVGYFSVYMRYLKNYDGIELLKQFLDEHTNISGNRFSVITALYETTMDPQYVDMMMDLYRNTRKLPFVAKITNSAPSEATFKALAYIYVNDKNSTNRSTAIDGLLHCSGYIKELHSYGKTDEDEMKVSRLLYFCDDIEERKKLVEKLETGQQLIEGIPVPEPLC